MERSNTVKEIQERKIVSSLEGINKNLGRIATYLEKIVKMKADQLTVLGEPEETEDDTEHAPG